MEELASCGAIRSKSVSPSSERSLRSKGAPLPLLAALARLLERSEEPLPLPAPRDDDRRRLVEVALDAHEQRHRSGPRRVVDVAACDRTGRVPSHGGSISINSSSRDVSTPDGMRRCCNACGKAATASIQLDTYSGPSLAAMQRAAAEVALRALAPLSMCSASASSAG